MLPNDSSQILLGNKKKFKIGSILDKIIANIKLPKKMIIKIDNKKFFKYLNIKKKK